MFKSFLTSLFILTGTAQASMPMGHPGGLRANLAFTRGTATKLAQKGLKRESVLEAEFSFLVPELGNYQPQSVATIEFIPTDSLMLGPFQGQKLDPMSSTDSSHHGLGMQKTLNLANAQAHSTVTFPVRWKVMGTTGSSLRARVMITNPKDKFVGEVNVFVAVQVDGTLKISNGWEMVEGQRDLFKTSEKERASLTRFDEESVPFSRTIFEKSLLNDSAEVNIQE